ncbi:murein biosynthesis integral membrane protein MurJ [Helicobacter jaachi]|uniref:Probable lipid II flippase MurJ n=1 Tax=Helicobacter jaachi TaxID=1677920 RepID=A0A4V6I2I6_9HELI|nr:murein biosynthesis integral membrane protein MurJ [Helicobacter jaachi]TLD96222.1 murein biosynthesis integral membrane protein MurJ [Helicobacter jaachi]
MIKKAFLTNSSGILLSRIAGLVRDLCTAKILGAGVYSDIFFAAFKLPNLFRRVFGEGAFTQSFLPNFIHSRRKGMFALITFMIFATFIFVLSLLVVCFSGFFTKLLAYGFDDKTIELAKPIVVINFWYLELVFIVTFLSSLLQYKNCFWVNAYNTALLNIAMISALLLAHDADSMQVVYMLSYGVICGGIAQILLHFYPLYHLGLFKLLCVGAIELWQWLCTKEPDIKLRRKIAQIKDDVKSFFKQFFPAMLGSSTAQLATFTDTLLASFLIEGSISALYYANRIFQFPLAIFAIAISTALFPLVAKAIKNKQPAQALNALKKSFWFLLLILCMCVLGGVMLSEEIISLLFEWGNFSAQNTLVVAGVFSAYMIGLVPFGLSKIFALWLYSHQMQGRAAKISAISLLCGIGFSLILMHPFGAMGLALSGSLSGFVLFILTIKSFGFKQFLDIINNKKAWLALILILSVEILLLWYLKPYIKAFVNAFHLFVRSIV